MSLPTKVKEQVRIMKLAVKQADLLESLHFNPAREDEKEFKELKASLVLSYATTMNILAESMFEIANT